MVYSDLEDSRFQPARFYAYFLFKAWKRDSKRNQHEEKTHKKKWKEMTEEERKEVEDKRSQKLDKQMEKYWNQTGEFNQMKQKRRN